MRYFIEDTTLTAIGDAVRAKSGSNDLIKVSELADAITNLPSGGGGGDLPEEALIITGECDYRFSNNGWNWFIENYGDRITTKDISNMNYMFRQLTLERIPFELNLKSKATSTIKCTGVFDSCTNLKEAPIIKSGIREVPSSNYSGNLNLDGLFRFCYNLREIPNDYFWQVASNTEFWEESKKLKGSRGNMFYGCYSLRELPDISMLSSAETSSSGTLYYGLGYDCSSLNKIVNIPVSGATLTSNVCNHMGSYAKRLKELTFETNEDGTAKTANWKKQVIDLTNYVGYLSSGMWDGKTDRSYLDYNSGITEDKEVIDDATYQALKDDPDWYTSKLDYCRYNRTSAVNTINSLPDTSASGGNNTIKFKGASGALTDGGAINTLTEEEIAVAASKGWTVSFV